MELVMQVGSKIGYNEIFNLVKQLPIEEIEKLDKSIRKELINKSQKNKKEKLQELILTAPTWTEVDYSNFLSDRKHINQSRFS